MGDRLDELIQRALSAVGELSGVDLLQHQAGGEGAHDRGQADLVGQPGEDEAEGEADRDQDAARTQPGGEAEQARRQQHAGRDGAHHEDDGLRHRHADLDAGQSLALVGRGGDGGDDGQHQQAEHVVDHRGAEHDAGFRRLDLAQILEDARGDPDAGGAEDRPDERVLVSGRAGQEPRDQLPAHTKEGDQ